MDLKLDIMAGLILERELMDHEKKNNKLDIK